MEKPLLDSPEGHPFVAFCNQGIFFCLCALVYFLPIAPALVEIFSILPAILFLLKRGYLFFRIEKNKNPLSFFLAFKPKQNLLNWPIFLWVLISFVSILFSQHQSVGFAGFFGKTIEGVFIFIVFLEAMADKKRLFVFLLIFFISGLLVCTSGLYQYFSGVDFVRGSITAHGRISSSLSEPNDLASYLVFLIPMGMAVLLLLKSDKEKALAGGLSKPSGTVFLWGWTGYVGLSLIVLILTFSRVGWAAALLAAGGVVLSNRRFIKPFIIGSLLFVGVAAVLMINVRSFMIWHNLFNLMGRVDYWHEAVNMIKDFPLFGVGLNAYSLVGRDYKINWGGYPHNCYLQMAAETGIPGLLCFLWMIVGAVGIGGRPGEKAKDGGPVFIVRGIQAGLAGFFFHIFFDTFFYSTQLNSLMWLFIGMAVVVKGFDQEFDAYFARKLVEAAGFLGRMARRHKHWFIAGFILLIAAVVGIAGLVPLEKKIEKNRERLRECEHMVCGEKQHIILLERGLKYNPDNKEILHALADAYDASGYQKKAARFYKKILQFDSGNARANYTVGWDYFNKGEWDKALNYFNNANRAYLSNYYLGRIYERQEDWVLAYDHYRQAQQYNQLTPELNNEIERRLNDISKHFTDPQAIHDRISDLQWAGYWVWSPELKPYRYGSPSWPR